MHQLVSPACSLENAYRYCEYLAGAHYENFPVASRILPKAIRRPIAVIYAFARQADDIADEGDLSTPERLHQLEAYKKNLETLQQPNNAFNSPVFKALQDVLQQHPNLPIGLFFDLLTAFKQDVLQNQYETFHDILHYCQYSANPVGRLLLHLTHNDSPEHLEQSDAVCSALQLINFLQDIRSDIVQRNRFYLPQDEIRQLGIPLEDLKNCQITPEIQDLIKTQLHRAEQLLTQGARLPDTLSGLFAFEIRCIITAAYTMLRALKKRNSPYIRPHIQLWQWSGILLRVLIQQF